MFENSENIRDTLARIFKTILKLFLFFILIFLLVKTFYLNRPKVQPEEIAIPYLKAEQNLNREVAEGYLLSDLGKVEILEEKYENFQNLSWLQRERKGKNPTFEVTDQEIEKNQARITVFEKTNKKENCLFFGYLLPEEIIFKITLEKEGSWRDGYEWKIIKISSPDLISKGTIKEQVEFKKGIFVKVVELEEYSPKNVKLPQGTKILSLKIAFENRTNKSVKIYSFEDWRIIGKNEQIFAPAPLTSAISLREPMFLGQNVEAGKIKKGYVVFEVPEEFFPEQLILASPEKKLIFELK